MVIYCNSNKWLKSFQFILMIRFTVIASMLGFHDYRYLNISRFSTNTMLSRTSDDTNLLTFTFTNLRFMCTQLSESPFSSKTKKIAI